MSSDLEGEELRRLVGLIRIVAGDTVSEALRRARVSTAIPGLVEDVNTERDVAYIRNDAAIDSVDLYKGIAENPGVAAMTRQGNTLTGEQVRAFFDGSSGGTATHTGVESRIVLPFGATSGKRIVIDGELGVIAFFDENDKLVGLLSTDEWAVGDLDPEGRRITLGPIGGLRIRDGDNALVAILDPNGLTLRDPETGSVVAEIRAGSARFVDPDSGDDIEFVTSTAGTLPTPAYVGLPEANPGASIVAPAAPNFTATPPDDLAIAHMAAWLNVDQAATATPPGGYSERLDTDVRSAAGTLAVSVATLHPATTAAATFTSSQSNWTDGIGTHVVLRGGGAASPSYGDIEEVELVTTDTEVTLSIPAPAGIVDGSTLVVFVTLACQTGVLPVEWVTPPDFKLQGVQLSASQRLADGAWVKRATAADAAATSYETTIRLPAGTKFLHAAMAVAQGAFLVPGGVQIRMAGKPIRRLLRYTQLPAASATLCDFGGPGDPLGPIPQSYDNLELVIDGSAAAAGADTRMFMRFNGNLTGNCFYRLTQLHSGATAPTGSASAFVLGAVSGAAGSQTSAEVKILGYTQPRRRVVFARAYWVDAAVVLRDDLISGQWDNVVDPINRVTVDSAKAFAAGSRAYLYGY